MADQTNTPGPQNSGVFSSILTSLKQAVEAINRVATALGTVIVTGHEVPPGGTTSQVLTKVSNTSYDIDWADPAVSGGTVTSVDVSGGTTGLSFSGGPVTSSGTITASGTLNVANGGTGATTAAGAQSNLGLYGRQTIWAGGSGLISRRTNGATPYTYEQPTSRTMEFGLQFDPSTVQYCQFNVGMPKSWDGGTIYAQVVWVTGGTSGDIVWALQGKLINDGTHLDGSWGTAVDVTDSTSAASTEYITTEIGPVTLAGTPTDTSIAWFQLYRDATNVGDTLASSAGCLGVRLYYTTDAVIDA